LGRVKSIKFVDFPLSKQEKCLIIYFLEIRTAHFRQERIGKLHVFLVEQEASSQH
jgi:hypothetical protein